VNPRGFHLALLVVVMGAWITAFLGFLASSGIATGWSDDIIAFLTACPYSRLTGEPCALCGTITAAAALFAGDIGRSIALNPLALGLMPLAVSQPVYRLARVIKPQFFVVEEIVVTGSGLVLLVAMLCVPTV
jgi:hypothetical protein